MRPLAEEHPTRSRPVSQSISSRMESPPSSQTRCTRPRPAGLAHLIAARAAQAVAAETALAVQLDSQLRPVTSALSGTGTGAHGGLLPFRLQADAR